MQQLQYFLNKSACLQYVREYFYRASYNIQSVIHKNVPFTVT